MPGQIRRPYTSYEMQGYDVYPSDVYENDPYERCPSPPPAEISDRYGAYSPMKGRQTPGARPSSRINHATQTESRLGHYRQGSPALLNMRLQRETTMPATTDEPLDPITKQYYNRLLQRSYSPDMNLNRMGRAGGRWRHITSCYANTGSHMAFVEGTVKQVDNNLLLPKRPPVDRRQFQNGVAAPQTSYRMSSAARRKPKYNSVFYDHAKNGFKYWYQDQNKPMDPEIDETFLDSLVNGRNITWHPVFS